MSVLVVNIIPEGIILGADRLLRWGPDLENRFGFAEGFKILRWPNRRALVGFVGMADLGRRSERNSTFEWLTDFIGSHHDFDTLESLAAVLCNDIQTQFDNDGWSGDDGDLLVLELAGFGATAEGQRIPEVWHIANAHGIDTTTGTYTNIDSNFGFSEEFLQHIPLEGRTTIREVLAAQPFWIHQTGDFALFNDLCGRLDQFFDRRLEIAGIVPTELNAQYDRLLDFESRVRMKVLSYGAFNDAFETPVTRTVGGGADVLMLEWPDM